MRRGFDKHIDVCFVILLSCLGWKLAEDKLVSFDSVCEAPGVQLDLKDAKLGLALVSNIQERVEEMTADIAEILGSGQLSKQEDERLRGSLQFANAQLFRRVMRCNLRA